jgi:hypothetical protein
MITQGIADTVRVRSVDDGKSYALTFDVKVEEGRRVGVTWDAGENPAGRLTDGQRVRVAGKVKNGEITSPVMIYNQDTKSFVKPFPGIPLLAKIGLVLQVALLVPAVIFILVDTTGGDVIWYRFLALVLAASIGAHTAAIYRLFATGSVEWFGLTERRIPAELTWSAAFFLGIFIVAIIHRATGQAADFLYPVLLLVASSPVVGVYFALFLVKSDRSRLAKLLWALIAALCLVVVVITLFKVPSRSRRSAPTVTPKKEKPVEEIVPPARESEGGEIRRMEGKWIKVPVERPLPPEEPPEETP